MNTQRRIHFLGLGFEKGQGKKGLVATATRARSYFPILKRIGYLFDDHGDVSFAHDGNPHRFQSESELANLAWAPYWRAFRKDRALLATGETLLNWGGDHSVAIATVGAFVHEFPDGHVLWIDAHADLNLPHASPSGFLHGMPLALLMNLQRAGERVLPWFNTFLDPSRLIYLGLRDLDPFETKTIKDLGIKHFTFSDVRELGLPAVIRDIRERVAGKPLHVSFDIDAMDPVFAPSTGVPVPGGLTPADLRLLGDDLFARSNVTSADIVEVNPELGSAVDVERTYFTAFQFLQSVFPTTGGIYARVGQGHQRDDEIALESRSPLSAESAPFGRVRVVSAEDRRLGGRID